MVDHTKTLINYRWEVNLLPFRSTLPHWGFWEKERLAAMYAAIRPGDTILDIGSEQGDLSALFAKWVGPTGKMILIEPSEKFWPNIRTTFEVNDLPEPDIAIHGFAFDMPSENWADAVTYGWPDVAHGAITADEIGFSYQNEHPHIRSVVLDNLTTIPKIDVVTVDIEGAEYEALLGMRGIIENDRPVLFMSIHPEFMWDRYRHSQDDLLVMLGQWGYDATFLAFDHEAHWLFKPRA